MFLSLSNIIRVIAISHTESIQPRISTEIKGKRSNKRIITLIYWLSRMNPIITTGSLSLSLADHRNSRGWFRGWFKASREQAGSNCVPKGCVPAARIHAGITTTCLRTVHGTEVERRLCLGGVATSIICSRLDAPAFSWDGACSTGTKKASPHGASRRSPN
jgi:hypothetical protein